MIYFSLPFFATNIIFNNYICYFLKNNPEARRFKDSFIMGNHGNFNFTYWNGDVNNNYGEIALYEDIFFINSAYKNSIRLNCSNIFLEQNDIFDTHINIIFELLKNSGNYIEISDLKLFEKISQQYPGFNFIFSENADLINPFTLDILNIIIKQNVFDFITLPKRLSNDENFISKLSNKDKYEIIVCDKCFSCSENKKQECSAEEQKYQINFSSKSVYQGCSLTKIYQTVEEDINYINSFIKKGFKYFKIDTCPYKDFTNFNNYLMELLIKPEYYKDFTLGLENNEHAY